MSVAARLGKASGFLFISGFIVGKLQYLPLALFSSILNIVSLLLYCVGYSLWFISSHFQPEHTIKKEEWYGFDEFKKQYLYAATIGIIASITGIAAVFLPVLFIPASWLFFFSNLVWSTGEYHKFNSPPKADENYSSSYQKAYLSFAVSMTIISLFAAAGTTVAILFPPAAVGVLLTTIIICLGLGVLAGEFWLDFNFGDHKKDVTDKSSYTQISNSLKAEPKLETEYEIIPEHSNSLFVKKQTEIEDKLKIQPDEPRQTCTPSP